MTSLTAIHVPELNTAYLFRVKHVSRFTPIYYNPNIRYYNFFLGKNENKQNLERRPSKLDSKRRNRSETKKQVDENITTYQNQRIKSKDPEPQLDFGIWREGCGRSLLFFLKSLYCSHQEYFLFHLRLVVILNLFNLYSTLIFLYFSSPSEMTINWPPSSKASTIFTNFHPKQFDIIQLNLVCYGIYTFLQFWVFTLNLKQAALKIDCIIIQNTKPFISQHFYKYIAYQSYWL